MTSMEQPREEPFLPEEEIKPKTVELEGLRKWMMSLRFERDYAAGARDSWLYETQGADGEFLTFYLNDGKEGNLSLGITLWDKAGNEPLNGEILDSNGNVIADLSLNKSINAETIRDGFLLRRDGKVLALKLKEHTRGDFK